MQLYHVPFPDASTFIEKNSTEKDKKVLAKKG